MQRILPAPGGEKRKTEKGKGIQYKENFPEPKKVSNAKSKIIQGVGSTLSRPGGTGGKGRRDLKEKSNPAGGAVAMGKRNGDC